MAPRLVVASTAPRRSSPRQRGFCVSAGTIFDGGDRQCRCDRQIDVEDHPPVGELGEETADEDADRGARASDCSPGGERLRPLVPVERRHDDRKRCRREHCCTEALARAGCEQSGRRARRGRRERRCGEDAEAGQEHPPTPEQVGGAAAEEEQASEDERVAGDRPADAGARELKVFREARQRDVHGRDVEDDHQLGDEHDEQEDATALAARADRGCLGVAVAVLCRDAWPPCSSGLTAMCGSRALISGSFSRVSGYEFTLALRAVGRK